MVLALKVPHGADFRVLLPLWPVFMSYVLSFIYVGIYWNKLQYASYPTVAKLFFLPFVLLINSASAAEPTRKTSAQLWEETVRQADMLLSIQTEFQKNHRFAGKPAQTAIDKLKEEGFRCSLQYKTLPSLTQGSTDRFKVENIPMIYCSVPHVAINQDDLCRTFWAGFEINWTDPNRPLSVLNQELGTSTVKDETYFCRVSNGSN